MSLFRMVASLGLDSSSFDAGLKRVESSAIGLSKKLGTYFTAGAIGYGIGRLARSAFDAATELADLSDQLGISTDDIQAIQKAAEEAGVEFGAYEQAIIRVKKAQADALSGNKAAIATFKALGVSPNAGILDILGAAGGATTPAQKAAAFDLIGTKVGRIMDSLAKIHALGPLELIDQSATQRLDHADDALKGIARSMRAIMANAEGAGVSALNAAAPVAQFWMERNLKAMGVTKDSPMWKRMLANPIAGAMTMMGMTGDKAYEIYDKETSSGRYSTERSSPLDLPDRSRLATSRKRQELLDKLNDPLNLQFQSSTANSRASIGAFYLGADRTAAMDIQKQQLKAQETMTDRIKHIDEQLAKLTED